MFIKAKIYLAIGLTLAIVVAVAAYRYKSLVEERDDLAVELTAKAAELTATMTKLDETTLSLERVRTDYAVANISLTYANAELAKAARRHDEKIKVFEKENGRFKLLFERKASLLVALANRATSRLWLELESETAISESGEGESNMPEHTSSGEAVTEFD